MPSTSAVHERRVALGVTTVGILAATLNASILLISLPAIFSGLGLDPLAPGNISLLLWMLMGYMLVTAVLVVTFGRLGDQYGRARLFNLGFAIFTAGSIACALIPGTESAGAWELVALRVFQGVGGAMLTANSTAIIADAFPADPALGISAHAIDPAVKIAKPRLNSLARPYWSPSRPNVTTSTAVTSM